MTLILLIVIFYIGVECGASWPWSNKWQSKKDWFSSIPEIVLAVIFGGMASAVWGSYQWLVLIPFIAIVLAGIQSATWSFLQWDTPHPSFNKGRTFTLKPIVDWIADRLNIIEGSEGYSWISATIKGTIITLPAGGLGGIFFALGYKVGLITKKYVIFNPMIVSEGLSYMFVGFYYLGFIKIMGIL